MESVGNIDSETVGEDVDVTELDEDGRANIDSESEGDPVDDIEAESDGL